MSHPLPLASHTPLLDQRAEKAQGYLARLQQDEETLFHVQGLTLATRLHQEKDEASILKLVCILGTLPFTVESQAGRSKAIQGFFRLKSHLPPTIQIHLDDQARIIVSGQWTLQAEAGPGDVHICLAMLLLAWGNRLSELATYLR